MPISTEIWVQDIAPNLFPDNSFVARGLNDDEFVENSRVNLPQSGNKPNVERNRSSFPASISERADGIEGYDLDSFTSDPTLIRDADAIEVSYAKRQSVLSDHINTLNTKIADWIAWAWAATTAGAYVRTSGADRTALAPGATGTRKKITLDDFLKAKRIMDSMDIPSEGRVCLLPSEMYNDLLEIDKILSRDFNGVPNLPAGAINQIYGISVYMRSFTVQYTDAATPSLRQPGATALATANAAGIFWHPDFVRRALGDVKLFADENKPEFYGSVFSTEARAGGRKRYSDGRGVVSLIETA